MVRIKNITDLYKIRDEVQSKKLHNKNVGDTENLISIKVGMATCGIASGAKEIMDYFLEETEQQAIDVEISKTGCIGYCYAEPTVEVSLPGREPVVFGYVNKNRAQEIIDKYIMKGELVDDVIPINFSTINE